VVPDREKENPMAMVTDPVCGMRIDPDDAAATAEYQGNTYYFCSEACRDAFLSDPTAYPALGVPGEAIARLSEEELVQRAGTTVDRIRELTALGMLEPAHGTFPPRDVMRVRVILDLEAKGLDVAALGAALSSGHLTLGYLESAGRHFPRSSQTFSRVAEEIGIHVDTLQRMYLSFGLPRPHENENVREEDLPVLKMLPVLFGAGVGEGDVLRGLRVWGESARRVARFERHYFHNTIEEVFRRRGLKDNVAFEAAIREVAFRMGNSGEQLLAWLYRRHAEDHLLEHQFDHVEAALDEAGVRQRAPKRVEASAFADLSGYTRLTEEAGDREAARVSLALAQFVSELSGRHRGEVVKMLGDGVFFHFPDPADAVRASLELVESVAPRGLPPAHVGVNAGPMIYEEGDYFGRTVNIAARIASRAGPDQVLVGEDAYRAITLTGFRLIEHEPLELKGIARPVTVYEAIRGDGNGE
jgi:adenylate cyclase